MEKIFHRIIYSIVLCVVVYLGFCIYSDYRALYQSLLSFPFLLLPGLLFLSLVNYFLRFLKWEYYLRLLSLSVPVGHSLVIFLSGFVMSITPGKMGEVLKSYLLKTSHGIEISKSAPIVVAERITDFLSLFILSILFGLGLVSLKSPRGIYIFTILLIAFLGTVLIITILSLPRLFHFFVRIFARIPFFNKLTPKIETAYSSLRTLIALKPLIYMILLSTLSWFSEGVALYGVLKGFGASPGLDLAVFIYAFATIAGAISMIPGGLGVTEGGLVGLILFFHLTPKAIAVASSLLVRFTTLWFAVILGLIALFIFKQFIETREGLCANDLKN